MSSDLFAACPRGLEAALAIELESFGATRCRPVGGGVLFDATRTVSYRVNLWSRLASRVLRTVAQRRYRDDDDLYRLAAGVEWEHFFGADHTLRVDVSAVRSPLRSLNYATLRIKDGIVDRLRAHTGNRPSIDTRAPDVRVFAHLHDRSAVLYLDLSGEALFKRGWRTTHDDKGAAPLKENLAAGLLALAGWSPSIPLFDPFCGSGTIVIEAAQIAFDIAPGASRDFGFEKLLDHDATIWAELRNEAHARAQRAARAFREGGGIAAIAASDIDARAIEQVRRNVVRAGLPDAAVRVQVLDVARAQPPFETPGYVVTNPPYGARIAARREAASGTNEDGPVGARDAPRAARGVARRPAQRPAQGTAANRTPHDEVAHEAAMRAFGQKLRNFAGWHVWVLTSDLSLPRLLGMKERRRTPLYNGAIECRFFGFEVFGRERGTRPDDDAAPMTAPATVPASVPASAPATVPASAPYSVADSAPASARTGSPPATNGAARPARATPGKPTRR